MNEQKNPLVEAMEEALENAQLVLPDTSFPDPSVINYYTFENDRKFFLDAEIGPTALELVKLIIRWNKEDEGVPVEDRKPITIYIMSPGGSLAYMWSLIDIMLLSETPITTVNMGIAASAAALILLAGNKRYALPASTVIIHEGSAELGGEASKVMDAASNYYAELKRMREFILKRTKISSRLMTQRSKDDWYIDAQGCLEHGICDKIVDSIHDVM